MNEKKIVIDAGHGGTDSGAIGNGIIEKELTSSGITTNGYYRFRLPYSTNDEYFLYVHSTSKVKGTYKQYTTYVNVDNILVKYKDLPKFMKTAFNSPIVRKPAVALVSDPTTKYMYLEVVIDNYTTLSSVVLTYYRKPLRFNTTTGASKCELPESVHSEIVDLAVNMFITEGKYRLQTKSSNQNNNG